MTSFLGQKIDIFLVCNIKAHIVKRDLRQEQLKAYEEQYLAELAAARENQPTAEEIEAMNNEFAKDARAKLFWIYRTRNMKELKV